MPEGTPHIQGTDEVAPPPRRDLVDDQLLEEIELLGDVITRVAGHGAYLSRAGGLRTGPAKRCPRSLPSPSRHRGLSRRSGADRANSTSRRMRLQPCVD